MPKKAGPKRIDPETFQPVVWRMKGKPIGGDLEFLVCQRRLYKPGAGTAMKHGKTVIHFVHPMALQISPRLDVLPCLKLISKAWEFDEPVQHGISERCAKVALAQAYHGVTATLNLVTIEPDYESKFGDLHLHKGGVRMRNVAIALRWTRWGNDRVAMDRRLEELGEVGFRVTKRQLERFAEEYGLPGIPG